jgi:hypothetical protein
MDRRYLKKILRYANSREKVGAQALAQIDPDSWFNGWHFHPDIKSRGNKAKPIMASLTYRLLCQAEARMEHRGAQAQVWATLEPNTGASAVFIHTDNPYGAPFPWNFAGVDWDVSLPQELERLIEANHEVGVSSTEDGICYYIRRRTNEPDAG